MNEESVSEEKVSEWAPSRWPWWQDVPCSRSGRTERSVGVREAAVSRSLLLLSVLAAQ